MARILFLGNSHPETTSLQRANALMRLGHTVIIKDPYKILEHTSNLLQGIHFKTGYIFLQKHIEKWVKNVIEDSSDTDIIWVDSGELLGPKCLALLKTIKCPLILYNVDDPTGKRDGYRFYTLLKGIKCYDLIVVVRKESETECQQLGAKKVLRVFRSYDEVAHHPFAQLSDIPAHFRSEVAFIGTWMRHEKRDEFIVKMIEEGIPVSIWGNRWMKSPNWATLKPFYKGGALSGRDYVAAIQGAKICLGFLSKGNRDLHTQRSLEVPYAGGLFCAERTTEHLELYHENEEAVFWSDVDECVKVCKNLLENEEKRETIRLAGMEKVRKIGVGNEQICKMILDSINIAGQ